MFVRMEQHRISVEGLMTLRIAVNKCKVGKQLMYRWPKMTHFSFLLHLKFVYESSEGIEVRIGFHLFSCILLCSLGYLKYWFAYRPRNVKELQ
jgi:hypothetical protein